MISTAQYVCILIVYTSIANKYIQEHSPHDGHYENKEIFHCVAAALFHSPNSVGVLFHKYFDNMPLETLAFIVAMVSQTFYSRQAQQTHKSIDAILH